MSPEAAKPQQKTVVARSRKITLEDVRRKAENVEQSAKDQARQVLQLDQTRMIIYAAVGMAVVAGVAYYMGTRAGRRPPQMPGTAAPSS